MVVKVANIEVECPYCERKHTYRLEYGHADDPVVEEEVIEAVTDDGD